MSGALCMKIRATCPPAVKILLRERRTHSRLLSWIKPTPAENTIAFSNFAGAAAGGFVGTAYLPHVYNDLTHTEQRIAFQFANIAMQNVAAEFQPQWGPLVRKLRASRRSFPSGGCRAPKTNPLAHPFQLSERNRIRICAKRELIL